MKKIEGHLHVPDEFLEHIIKRLREPYRLCLEPADKKLEGLSLCGNLLGAIQEVSMYNTGSFLSLGKYNFFLLIACFSLCLYL